MIGLFVRYHVRPAVRYFMTGVTPLALVGAVSIFGLFAAAYWGYFAAVTRGQVPVEVSLHHLRALTLELVVGFLVAGLRKRQGMVTFWSSTPLSPADALRLLLLTNGGKAVGGAAVFVAFDLPFVLRLSPSIERAVLHVASDAVAVVLHYLAATVIAVLWQRRRKDGARAAAVFIAFVGVELLMFRQWPAADHVLLPLNIAACVACWTVVIGRLNPTRIQRFLVSAVPRRSGRSTLHRLLRPLPVEARLHAKEFLLRRESAIPVLIALALFVSTVVLLLAGIPEETRAATINACMYLAAVSATPALPAFDRQRLAFFKTTPVTFGRLTYTLLVPHCVGYFAAAAIVGSIGMAVGMGLGALLVLLSQGLFLALVAWLIPFRYLYSLRLFGGLVSGFIMTAGLFLAVAATVVPGSAFLVAYAGFALLVLAFLYPGASVKYQDSTVEDWAPAS